MEQYAAVQWKQTNEIKTEQHRRRKKKNNSKQEKLTENTCIDKLSNSNDITVFLFGSVHGSASSL